ncbi:MAG: hypothetical protein WCY97_05780 [Methanothrix sp.]|jgi:YbbR domain-containing protein|uniref:Uncharacterized protein n=1 Tax=Methanothrix harundinacea TaxID=301375 RepID=A0A101IMT3_9EURY|nr:MAG: Uncharacterized protein XD72_1615 [Methanothrix harundinacea]MDD2637442.1 hypothetical protein [Methanothrix sp.]MDI9399834.1 hypothetical protein [Euryarchaeota archaeon]KUK97755.1 MAG: Uncharacterized protein XE07_0169 [Methanothrix harundinacea]MCP1392476.1 hypothetical protein [Methanothrix harundinacea]
MVSLNVNAEAKAKVQGSEDAERYPIVAEVKGPGKDGGLKVGVDIGSPISVKVSGERESPVAVDLPEIQQIANSFAKMVEGVKVEVAGQKDAPLKVALGRIPVDLTISVTSPKDESVLTVSIKGSIGD